MKTKEEIYELYYKIWDDFNDKYDDNLHYYSFVEGYIQCQEDNMENKYTGQDMEDYAKFCINCHINKVPCIIADNWFEQIKKI